VARLIWVARRLVHTRCGDGRDEEAQRQGRWQFDIVDSTPTPAGGGLGRPVAGYVHSSVSTAGCIFATKPPRVVSAAKLFVHVAARSPGRASIPALVLNERDASGLGIAQAQPRPTVRHHQRTRLDIPM